MRLLHKQNKHNSAFYFRSNGIL